MSETKELCKTLDTVRLNTERITQQPFGRLLTWLTKLKLLYVYTGVTSKLMLCRYRDQIFLGKLLEKKVTHKPGGSFLERTLWFWISLRYQYELIYTHTQACIEKYRNIGMYMNRLEYICIFPSSVC